MVKYIMLINWVRQTNTRIISDNTLNYSKQIGDHEISALAGVTIQKRRAETSQIVGTGYSNDLLKNLQGATTIASFQEINTELKSIIIKTNIFKPNTNKGEKIL